MGSDIRRIRKKVEKLGKKIADKVKLSLKNPLEENIKLVCEATGKSVKEVMVCVLNRPRHQKIIDKLIEKNTTL